MRLASFPLPRAPCCRHDVHGLDDVGQTSCGKLFLRSQRFCNRLCPWLCNRFWLRFFHRVLLGSRRNLSCRSCWVRRIIQLDRVDLLARIEAIEYLVVFHIGGDQNLRLGHRVPTGVGDCPAHTDRDFFGVADFTGQQASGFQRNRCWKAAIELDDSHTVSSPFPCARYPYVEFPPSMSRSLLPTAPMQYRGQVLPATLALPSAFRRKPCALPHDRSPVDTGA